jgi:transcriptional regulator with XRE-family HTH domain
MSNLEEKFSEILQRLRKNKELSQDALAAECELDGTYISLLERGQRQPTVTTLFKLSKVLGISPSSIIKGLERNS